MDQTRHNQTRHTPSTPNTSLYVTDDVGFYRRGTDLFRVRWNRKRTARYAEQLYPPAPTPTRPQVVTVAHYRGQGPLHDLTAGDRIGAVELLRLFAEHGPYDTCLFCHYEITEDLPARFGVGVRCAEKHLGVTRRVLQALFRHTPPTGPGVPIVAPPDRAPSTPRRGHLRLVAVDGRLVAA